MVSNRIRPECTGTKKRNRKSIVLPWKKDIEKYRRCQPKAPPLEPNCKHNNSNLQCNSLTKEEVKTFYKRFYYTRDRGVQDAFILRHCEGRSPKTKRNGVEKRRRQVSALYFVSTRERRVRVCRSAFAGILGVNAYRISYLLSKIRTQQQIHTPSRLYAVKKNKTSKKKVTFAKTAHFKSFSDNTTSLSPEFGYNQSFSNNDLLNTAKHISEEDLQNISDLSTNVVPINSPNISSRRKPRKTEVPKLNLDDIYSFEISEEKENNAIRNIPFKSKNARKTLPKEEIKSVSEKIIINEGNNCSSFNDELNEGLTEINNIKERSHEVMLCSSNSIIVMSNKETKTDKNLISNIKEQQSENYCMSSDQKFIPAKRVDDNSRKGVHVSVKDKYNIVTSKNDQLTYSEGIEKFRKSSFDVKKSQSNILTIHTESETSPNSACEQHNISSERTSSGPSAKNKTLSLTSTTELDTVSDSKKRERDFFLLRMTSLHKMKDKFSEQNNELSNPRRWQKAIVQNNTSSKGKNSSEIKEKKVQLRSYKKKDNHNKNKSLLDKNKEISIDKKIEALNKTSNAIEKFKETTFLEKETSSGCHFEIIKNKLSYREETREAHNFLGCFTSNSKKETNSVDTNMNKKRNLVNKQLICTIQKASETPNEVTPENIVMQKEMEIHKGSIQKNQINTAKSKETSKCPEKQSLAKSSKPFTNNNKPNLKNTEGCSNREVKERKEVKNTDLKKIKRNIENVQIKGENSKVNNDCKLNVTKNVENNGTPKIRESVKQNDSAGLKTMTITNDELVENKNTIQEKLDDRLNGLRNASKINESCREFTWSDPKSQIDSSRSEKNTSEVKSRRNFNWSSPKNTVAMVRVHVPPPKYIPFEGNIDETTGTSSTNDEKCTFKYPTSLPQKDVRASKSNRCCPRNVTDRTNSSEWAGITNNNESADKENNPHALRINVGHTESKTFDEHPHSTSSKETLHISPGSKPGAYVRRLGRRNMSLNDSSKQKTLSSSKGRVPLQVLQIG